MKTQNLIDFTGVLTIPGAKQIEYRAIYEAVFNWRYHDLAFSHNLDPLRSFVSRILQRRVSKSSSHTEQLGHGQLSERITQIAAAVDNGKIQVYKESPATPEDLRVVELRRTLYAGRSVGQIAEMMLRIGSKVRFSWLRLGWNPALKPVLARDIVEAEIEAAYDELVWVTASVREGQCSVGLHRYGSDARGQAVYGAGARSGCSYAQSPLSIIRCCPRFAENFSTR